MWGTNQRNGQIAEDCGASKILRENAMMYVMIAQTHGRRDVKGVNEYKTNDILFWKIDKQGKVQNMKNKEQKRKKICCKYMYCLRIFSRLSAVVVFFSSSF